MLFQLFSHKFTNDPKKKQIAAGVAAKNYFPACQPADLVTDAIRLKADLSVQALGKWSEKLEHFIVSLSSYCAVVDVAVQHSPHNTALVWGAIRFIIQAVVANQETSEEIDEALDFLLRQVANYHESLSLFSQEPRIRESTIEIYALIYSYTLRLSSYEEHILIHAYRIAAETQRRKERARSLEHQTAMERAEKTERLLSKVRRWLEAPSANAETIPDWQKGTCSWILENEIFRQWSQTRGEGCLWVHGKPGCGKSVLAKYLTTTLKDQYVLTHFFRDHGDSRFGLGQGFALSLISKTLEMHDAMRGPAVDSVLASITPLMNMPSSRCRLETLLSILNKLLDLLPSFTMLVDAVDECRDIQESGCPLRDFFLHCGGRSNSRILLFCRSHVYGLDYMIALGRSIVMDPETMASDVRTFLTSEIRNLGLEVLLDVVLQKASRDGQGMFLWARLMIQHIKSGHSLKSCKKLIDSFPTGLYDVYDKFIADAEEYCTAEDLELRYDILLLLVGAQENLTAAEISTAMAYSPETYELDNEAKLINAEKRITSVCWPLIEFTSDRRIQFIHGTVREFLVSKPAHRLSSLRNSTLRLSLEDSNESLARKTLAALTQETYQTWQYSAELLQRHLLPGEDSIRASSTVCDQNDFYEYSCRHWQYHLTQLAEPISVTLDLLCQFLRRNAFVAWSEAMIDLTNLSTPTAQVSVRATLREWYKTKLKPALRPKVALEDFFLIPHRELKEELTGHAAHTALPYLPLVRLGEFYNVGGETAAEWKLGYKFKKQVVEGYETVLGKRHRLTLSARTSLYQEYLWQTRMWEAKEGLQEVSEMQLESVGTDLPDYYITLYYLGAAEYHLTLFQDSHRTLETSAEGLQRLLGEINSKAVQATLFMGYTLEAQGLLSDAISLYDDIWKRWTRVTGENNGLALMIQTAQGSAYRKQRRFDLARKSLSHSWAVRKQLFTLDNNVTVDSGMQLAILCRDLGDNAGAGDTLDEVMESKIFPGDFERICQVDHVRALIEFDSGQYHDGKRRLLRRLDEAGNCDKDPNNRELLWIRITLADVMRAHGETDDALMLFSNLVTPSFLPGELDEEPEPPQQLQTAEKALRYIQSYNPDAAEMLLQGHKLKWRRAKDFWILQGGPISDSARMAAPRTMPD
ncbi:hypothetical protein BJX63DRAFT_316956 [Aspergillus granulosus]|uniref:NACHT domain-containing protein n=1 Tax=Aspergillus granulosus TaxID=176169 RepID=A0ABR4H4W8_9EURO